MGTWPHFVCCHNHRPTVFHLCLSETTDIAGVCSVGKAETEAERTLGFERRRNGVRAAAGIHADRNGLIAADSVAARQAWLTVAGETRRVLELASDAAAADDAQCIARGQYDDLSAQY